MTDSLLRSESSITNADSLEAQKDLFLATLVHDLKNPIQAQHISLKMLLDGILGDLKSEQKEIINMILESNNYMQDMLYSILGVYKFENGIISLDKKWFDAADLVEICLNEVKCWTGDKNIRVIVDFDEDTRIFSDFIQLRRVISNLLNNAIKYSFQDSSLKISIKNNNNSRLLFCFENSSPEIPREIKENMFEKFVSGAKNFKISGVGLGLYYCKKVIEAHGGMIYLDGNGTCNKFIFEVPIYLKEDREVVSLD